MRAAQTDENWPCSAKRERSLPESESSLWPAAKMKTKCSRKRTGYSWEHRIFHVAKLKALEKSPGHWNRLLVALKATTSILRCTVSWHEQAQKSPLTRRETCTEEDWESDHGLKKGKAPALRREEGGEECPSGRCLLSLQEQSKSAAAKEEAALVWMMIVDQLLWLDCV